MARAPNSDGPFLSIEDEYCCLGLASVSLALLDSFQHIPYGTLAWKQSYGRRNIIEKSNAMLKDKGGLNAGWCRAFGLAAQTMGHHPCPGTSQGLHIGLHIQTGKAPHLLAEALIAAAMWCDNRHYPHTYRPPPLGRSQLAILGMKHGTLFVRFSEILTETDFQPASARNLRNGHGGANDLSPPTVHLIPFGRRSLMLVRFKGVQRKNVQDVRFRHAVLESGATIDDFCLV